MSAHPVRGVDDVVALVRDAAARDAGLRIVGAGRWPEPARRLGALGTLDLSSLRGVQEYTPGDLTISVGAGTTLAELDDATRAHGQWCPLLPWGDDQGTVGATIATASAGPFAAALGRPRDLVIGLECVDGTGRIVRAGGRVVKNVAGFDLVRLMTGQWGTLGIVTQLHLRLRARPVVDETVRLRLGGDAAADHERLRVLSRGPYAPLACVLLRDGHHLLRFGGNRAFVATALAAARELGDCEAADVATWDDVRREQAPNVTLDAWRSDALARRIKERFDPHDVLNRGLLGSQEPAPS